jgi:glycosyltransferase involved in cell wall biosynthesis
MTEFRVLHVIATNRRRGGELFASDLIRALSGDGLSQHVAVIRGSRDERVEYQAPSTVLPSGLSGFNVDPRGLRGLGRLVKSWKPHVVQAHGGEPLKYAVLVPGVRRRNLVYRRIGGAPRWITHGPRRAMHAVLMRRAARVVVVAEALRRETIELFRVPERRVVTIPNAVDAARLGSTKSRGAARGLLGIPQDAGVILSVGALTWEKDPLAHLEVTQDILRADARALHLFAGEGPLRPALEGKVNELGLGKQVRILGSRNDVPELLAASDIMLLASAVEGMPGSVIEAGMLGVPVVGYALAGVPELVADGETGRLGPPGDVDALRQRVEDLLKDSTLRERMGIAARERCMSLFNINAVAPRYLALYEEVAAS